MGAEEGREPAGRISAGQGRVSPPSRAIEIRDRKEVAGLKTETGLKVASAPAEMTGSFFRRLINYTSPT